jgi:hypothetical protein
LGPIEQCQSHQRAIFAKTEQELAWAGSALRGP